MWIFAYQGQSGTASYDGTGGIPVADGQYFFQLTEDGTASEDDFLSYNRSTGQYETITAYKNNNAFYTFYVDGAVENIQRLDVFNCKEYGWCHNGGSYYSVRENIQVYDSNNLQIDTIYTDEYIIFENGYGYTPGGRYDDKTLARVYGKSYDGGRVKTYPSGSFADIDPTQHPAAYGVNTY